MITLGSVSRAAIARVFPFLAEKFAGRRSAIKELTHTQPDFVFWVFPSGQLHDARDAHASNVPKGFESILDDEPDYGGFLRGRIVTSRGQQLVVVYCRSEALAEPGPTLAQFLCAMQQVPVPLADDALVISDNAYIYGNPTSRAKHGRQLAPQPSCSARDRAKHHTVLPAQPLPTRRWQSPPGSTLRSWDPIP